MKVEGRTYMPHLPPENIHTITPVHTHVLLNYAVTKVVDNRCMYVHTIDRYYL